MASGNEGGFWMPPQGSTVAGEVDQLFDFIYWVSVFFFVAITIATVYFVVKYKRRSDDQLATSQVGHNTLVEATWTFVPLVLVLVMFAWGFRTFLNLTVAPEGAYQVKVTGQKWSWNFTHPDGTVTTGDLHVPANRPVKLLLSSRDVIHSFYVPDFRIKQDAVPGRYTTAWFQAKAAGEHQVFCTEYCGKDHSAMLAKVLVLSEEEFDAGKWKVSKPPEGMSVAEWGGQLYNKVGCKACHSVDGSKLVGPSFKGLYGRTEKITGQDPVQVDENYLRESIMDPQAKIVEGYAPAMPSYKGQLDDAKLDALIAYIKTLK